MWLEKYTREKIFKETIEYYNHINEQDISFIKNYIESIPLNVPIFFTDGTYHDSINLGNYAWHKYNNLYSLSNLIKSKTYKSYMFYCDICIRPELEAIKSVIKYCKKNKISNYIIFTDCKFLVNIKTILERSNVNSKNYKEKIDDLYNDFKNLVNDWIKISSYSAEYRKLNKSFDKLFNIVCIFCDIILDTTKTESNVNIIHTPGHNKLTNLNNHIPSCIRKANIRIDLETSYISKKLFKNYFIINHLKRKSIIFKKQNLDYKKLKYLNYYNKKK